ncbi:uncharacterized protein [Littorina saxatilis]|uniref:alpha-amylase n=1 Tax=Littorina saxatilis TaxID=31220 RepID=A0AAN9GIW2_9CAEN
MCESWCLCVIVTALITVPVSHCRTAEEWKSRVIYQLLTDRFGPSGPVPVSPCADLRSYCGGTFRGIVQRLDYIHDLGANAIWISPFVENTDGGFHGYWAKDMYSVNPHMGTKQELMDLVHACHQRDIWVMMDVVANHMGPPMGSRYNFTGYVPFNETWHYHDYCVISDWLNQTEVELCRLSTLPDLNQSVPYVRDALLAWIHDVTAEYGFDGYRVDTAVEVQKWFWPEFTASAGVFLMGEANNGDRTCYTGGYQGPLPSVLNFPLYWAMRRAFNEGQSMTQINKSLALQRKCFKDTSVLGLFVDNHDFPRFLNLSDDTALLRNALTYVMFGQGIPIIYYGTEQDFHGGNDPHNRESLWPCYNQTSSTYLFVKGMLAMRHRLAVYFPLNNQVELYADDHLMVFTRGALSQILVAITNVGQNANITRTLTNLPFKDKTTFINVDHANDTLVVQNASFTISLQHGYPKVYVLEFAVNTTQSDTSRRGNRSHDVITICALWAWAVANVVTFVGSLLVH